MSDGKEFATGEQWIAGHGYGSTNQYLVDVNNDNKSDAVLYLYFHNLFWKL